MSPESESQQRSYAKDTRGTQGIAAGVLGQGQFGPGEGAGAYIGSRMTEAHSVARVPHVHFCAGTVSATRRDTLKSICRFGMSASTTT
jgi:hypothetical protein